MNSVISFNSIKTSQNISTNVLASFNSINKNPEVEQTAYIHPLAAVIGKVYLGKRVMVAPGASIRGDKGQAIWVGNDVNVQDGVVLQTLEAYHQDELIEEGVVEVGVKFSGVYIDDRVSLTPQCQIHGPASIGADTFVGMQALVFRATVGRNCVIEPKALVMGVKIDDGRYVPAGALITTQEAADNLPFVNQDYPLKNFNRVAVSVNTQLATDYQEREIQSDPKDAA